MIGGGYGIGRVSKFDLHAFIPSPWSVSVYKDIMWRETDIVFEIINIMSKEISRVLNIRRQVF